MVRYQIRGVFKKEIFLWADAAVIGIHTIQASHFSQLLGPYSRFEWNHPGPILFYMLVPFYVLSGGKTAFLILGVFVINLIAISCIIVTLYKNASSLHSYLIMLLLFTIYLSFFGALNLTFLWNPIVVILPIMLLFFLCAGLSVGKISNLPLIFFIASFVVQTHIGTAPIACSIVGISIIFYIFYYIKRKKGFYSEDSAEYLNYVKYGIIAFIILFLMWLPPLIEELTHSPGNLTKLYRFFTKKNIGHSFNEVFKLTSTQMLLPIISFLGLKLSETGAKIIFLLLLLIIYLGVFVEYKQKKYYGANVCALTFIGIVIAFWSVRNIRGDVNEYLIKWVSGLGIIGLIGAVDAFLPFFEQFVVKNKLRTVMSDGFLSVVFVLVLVLCIHYQIKLDIRYVPLHNYEVGQIAKEVKQYLNQNRINDYFVHLVHKHTWPVAASVILFLYEEGEKFTIDDENLFMFGEQFKNKGNSPTVELQFYLKSLNTNYKNLILIKEGHCVDTDYAIYVYLKTKGEKYQVYKSPSLCPTHNVNIKGDPKKIIDGVISPNGANYDDPLCVVLMNEEASVCVAVPDGNVTKLVLSADGNDELILYGSKDNLEFKEIGLCPSVDGYGMQERECFLNDDLSHYKWLKISPRAGDGYYSISEIMFLAPVDEPSVK